MQAHMFESCPRLPLRNAHVMNNKQGIPSRAVTFLNPMKNADETLTPGKPGPKNMSWP
jgi:hypothetical protein